MNFGPSLVNIVIPVVAKQSAIFRVIAVKLSAEETSEHTKGGAPGGCIVGSAPCQELGSCLPVGRDMRLVLHSMI